MKVHIGRVQIPMGKVARFDKAVFSKTPHAARKLLEARAAASRGWNETQDSHGGLYAVMGTFVR